MVDRLEQNIHMPEDDKGPSQHVSQVTFQQFQDVCMSTVGRISKIEFVADAKTFEMDMLVHK
jgi:hypothetical protein